MKSVKFPNKFMMRFYQVYAFSSGRRNQMLLTFRTGFIDRFYFQIWRIFFAKNIIHERDFRSKSQVWADDIFVFRNKENLEKFEKAKRIHEKEGFTDEYQALCGEALGYPDFAVKDFMELSELRKGDRISFKCFEYGYDGFVCRPENFEKLKEWIKSQNIPFEKVIISDNETGKWRRWTLVEFENRKNKA